MFAAGLARAAGQDVTVIGSVRAVGPGRAGTSGLSTSRPTSRLALVAFGMSFGVMTVALSFAASRTGSGLAGPAYWVGQAVVYGVPSLLLLQRQRVTRREAVGVAWLVPLASYAITEAYSPLQFRFLDEFLTVRTAEAILSTHHLFHVNPALVVSPQYPGIEIVTAALASLSHLSIEVSGAIVAGVAHEFLGVAVYFLMLQVTRRPRIAALTVLLYATGPHFQFFDSYFIYETLALPLMVACLLATSRMMARPDSAVGLGWGAVAIAFAAATVVTHHVTSYALVGFLTALEVAQLLWYRGARREWRLPCLVAITVGLITFWDLHIATATVAYFAPFVQPLLESPLHFIARGTAAGTVTLPGGPRFDLALEYASILMLCLLVMMGFRRLGRARRGPTPPLLLGFTLASGGLFIALAVRVVGPDAGQLWGRASTYFMLPASLSIAVVIITLSEARRRQTPRMRRWGVPWLGAGVVVLLGVGGIAGGWPAYYARLPGAFRVEASERSIDQHNLDLASWAAKMLPPNYGVASDFETASLMAALGHEAAPSGVSALFFSKRFLPSARKLVRDKQIDFIVVDRRMAQQTPADGAYFADEPATDRHPYPIPAADLRKFDNIAGLSRIFDDGTMTVYALAGSVYRGTAPSGK